MLFKFNYAYGSIRLMKKLSILLFIIVNFSGCVYFNDRGVSLQRYNDCKEYYDSMGVYHKKCDENLIDYDDIKLPED